MQTSITMLAALILFCPVTARADQAVLESVRDNTIYEDANGSKSNGSGSRFYSGRKMGFGIIDRGLVKFDVAGNIPSGATILSANLQLYMTNANSPIAAVSLHRVLVDWGEAGSVGAGTGAPAETGDATWLHTFYDTVFWASPGGDFVAAASSTQMVDQEVFYVWGPTAEMIADVQTWLDNPSTNFGWIVIGDENAEFSDKAYATREHETLAWRPKLTVQFFDPLAGIDSDSDGVPDVDDDDPADPNVCRDLELDGCDDCAVTGADGSGGDPFNDGPDGDSDGVCDASDNCLGDANADQADADTDGMGDACDDDDDNDGVLDGEDINKNNPFVCRDLDQDGCHDCSVTGADGSGGDVFNDGPDGDGDGVCDMGDNCRGKANANQVNTDGDGIGDACDDDDDNDGVADANDSQPQNRFVCRDLDQDGCDDCSVTGSNKSGGDPFNDGPDADGDGVCAGRDNCAGDANADQTDTDGDGMGDACDDDDDNDGVADADDSQPRNPFACRDVDQDGCDDCANTGQDGSGGDTSNDGADRDGDGLCDLTDSVDDSANDVPQGGFFFILQSKPGNAHFFRVVVYALHKGPDAAPSPPA